MKSSIRLNLMLLLSLELSQGLALLKAQSPITSFSGGYTASSSSILSYLSLPALLSSAFSGCTATSYNYSYNNGSSNQFKLNSFNASGVSFLVAPSTAGVVKLRRVNNTNVTGIKNILYMETTASSALACPSLGSLNFRPPYIDVMEDLLNAGVLNQGTDNLFTNTGNGDGNNNNIERVDVIWSTGLNTATPSEAGFAIFDRGGNYQHDGFHIVAITGLDASGNPSSFGTVKTCIPGNGSSSNGSWGHPSVANGNRTFPCYVLRKDVSDTRLRVSSNVNQEIGGVFYTFADLGISSGQPLYGYALLGPDGAANPTASQLLNLNNIAAYPTTTTEAAGGGLDLVAVNTVFATGSYVVLPLTVNDFTGMLDNGQAKLQWQIQNAAGGEKIYIQRSDDGNSFTTLGASAIGNFVDSNTPAAGAWYRLNILSAGGQTSYSQVLYLHGSRASADFKAYPTVMDGRQPIHLEGLSDGRYVASFYDISGRGRHTQLEVSGRNALLEWPSGTIPAGMYRLILTTGDGTQAGQTTLIMR